MYRAVHGYIYARPPTRVSGLRPCLRRWHQEIAATEGWGETEAAGENPAAFLFGRVLREQAGLQNLRSRVRLVDPVPSPRGADPPAGPSKPGGEVRLLGGAHRGLIGSRRSGARPAQAQAEENSPASGKLAKVLGGARTPSTKVRLGCKQTQERSGDRIGPMTTDGSRVWPSGEAAALQAAPDGFDSHGPLRGIDRAARKRPPRTSTGVRVRYSAPRRRRLMVGHSVGGRAR